MHEVTHDFLVVHIKASQKSLGDKPKSVHIFLQTPREVYTRKSYFLDNSGNKHPNLTNLGIYSHVFRVTDYVNVASVVI